MFFAHSIDFFLFFALPILKKKNELSGMFLFGMILGVDSNICTILEQSINNKMVSKI